MEWYASAEVHFKLYCARYGICREITIRHRVARRYVRQFYGYKYGSFNADKFTSIAVVVVVAFVVQTAGSFQRS